MQVLRRVHRQRRSPLNLPVIGNVQVTGSDSRAAAFNSQWLPQFQTIINNNLQESVVLHERYRIQTRLSQTLLASGSC